MQSITNQPPVAARPVGLFVSLGRRYGAGEGRSKAGLWVRTVNTDSNCLGQYEIPSCFFASGCGGLHAGVRYLEIWLPVAFLAPPPQ